MKYTGWAVLIIGVLIGGFALFSMDTLDPSPPPQVDDPGAGTPGSRPFPIAFVLIPFSLVAIVAGVAMLMARGNGVIRTKNLAVRN